MTVITQPCHPPGQRGPMTGLLAARWSRLLTLAIVVAVACGVVAMHQLAASHDGHAGTSAAVVKVSDGGGDTATGHPPAGPDGTAAVCVLAAGCVLALALIVLRPARRSRASYPVSGRTSNGAFAAGVRRPSARARSFCRLPLSVCRT